ncbi:hypothetical protein [Photobacterium damselae]|uniref:hypothetical protein n=1 Tax=Photobacterium damselae TaxID=38293 RepID=UPI001EFC494D|nr:hypothetical protein [Photobacterium damselae]MCG9778826.1 hypothetical protein [Photobacterium damselae]
MRINKFFIACFGIILPYHAFAINNSTPEDKTPIIAIDSLVKFANKKNHSTYFSVVNSGKNDAYLLTKMTKVDVVNNKLVKQKLSITNMNKWKLFVSPPKMILRGGEEKKIKVQYHCTGDECNTSKDIVYQIPITPVPYTEDKGPSSINMAFGFSPYFIIPAKDQKVNYDYKIKNGKFHIKNTGNTYINAVISICEKIQKNDCIYEYKVLSGRDIEFKLPKKILEKKSGLLTVVNYDQSYRKTDKIYFN